MKDVLDSLKRHWWKYALFIVFIEIPLLFGFTFVYHISFLTQTMMAGALGWIAGWYFTSKDITG